MPEMTASQLHALQNNLNGKTTAFVLAHLGVGGAQKIASFVMNELIEQGVDVTAIAHYETEEYVFLNPAVKRVFVGVNPSPANAGLAKKVILKTRCIKKYVQIFRKLNPDCIVMFGPDPLPNIALSICNYQGKVIECERGDLNARNRLFRYVLKRCTARADAAVFQFPGARTAYGNYLPRVTADIPNPCGMRDDCIEAGRKKTNLVIAAGRLVPEKRFDLAINAFSDVVPIFPEKKLIIYGEGPEKERLEELIHSKGLRDSVFLLEPVKNLPDVLSNAELFLLTSDYEGLPNTLIEAMVQGVPVIATDCSPGGARFLTENGTIGGPLVPCGDKRNLARAMIRMLSNEELANEYGRLGQNLKRKYSPSTIACQWMSLFSSVLSE